MLSFLFRSVLPSDKFKVLVEDLALPLKSHRLVLADHVDLVISGELGDVLGNFESADLKFEGF